MTGDLFDHYAARTREAIANGFGCSTSDFDSHALTITDRPADQPWYTFMAVTFGTGTVLRIDPAYRAFAEAQAPDKHYQAMGLGFLTALVAEAAGRGATVRAYSPSLCFTIASEPPDLPVPPGFDLREHDAAWMLAEMPNRTFHNGIGVPGEDGREFRNRFALVLYDRAGEPAAVAGAFDTHGMLEIGVDVAREHRGSGLGRLVVSALAREIMRRGEIPFYGCGTSNIRSHRTAESCGFRIICADAFVSGPL